MMLHGQKPALGKRKRKKKHLLLRKKKHLLLRKKRNENETQARAKGKERHGCATKTQGHGERSIASDAEKWRCPFANRT